MKKWEREEIKVKERIKRRKQKERIRCIEKKNVQNKKKREREE